MHIYVCVCVCVFGEQASEYMCAHYNLQQQILLHIRDEILS